MILMNCILSYVFLFLYLIAAVLNLAGTEKGREKLFKFTKPALLLLLCLYCLFRTLPSPDLLIIAAIVACWLGDVLLMIDGEAWFTAGGVSFFAGHVLLILVFARQTDISRVPLVFLIPAAALYVTAAGFVMARARKTAPLTMQIPMLLYLFCNAAMNLFALSRLLESPGIWQAVSYVGAILFFLSDCALFLLRYDNERKSLFKTDFFVMLTYICGVLFITLGLVPPIK